MQKEDKCHSCRREFPPHVETLDYADARAHVERERKLRQDGYKQTPPITDGQDDQCRWLFWHGKLLEIEVSR